MIHVHDFSMRANTHKILQGRSELNADLTGVKCFRFLPLRSIACFVVKK